MRWPLVTVVLAFAGLAGPATGAISVYGSSAAIRCYERAEDESTYTRDCDEALREGELTQRDTASTLVNRGIIYNTSRRFDLAIADFNAALKIEPDLGEAFLSRGNALYLQERFEEALADYDRAIELKLARMHAGYFNRALAYGSLGRMNEAKADLEAALAIAPDFKEAQDRLALVNRLIAKYKIPPPDKSAAAPL